MACLSLLVQATCSRDEDASGDGDGDGGMLKLNTFSQESDAGS